MPKPVAAVAQRKSFLLRIPPDLWRDLEALAAADLRSVNAEIEYLLREAAVRRKRGGRVQIPASDAETTVEASLSEDPATG